MAQNLNLQQKISPSMLIKCIVAGAAFNLILIGIFLSGINDADPEWGKHWMVRPLIIVPVGGAVGGAVFYTLYHYRAKFGFGRAAATIAGLIIYIVGLWMSTVLGLVGTLWN